MLCLLVGSRPWRDVCGPRCRAGDRGRAKAKLAALSLELEQARQELREAGNTIRSCEEKLGEAKENCQAEIAKLHSSISHGFRIPLAIMQGYADLLAGELVTDEAARREYLQKICERVYFMNDMLSKLLAESRAEAYLPSIVPSRTDVLDLIRNIAESCVPLMNSMGIRIQIISTEEHVYADVDATQLTKIFYHIIDNSAKYMGRPGTIYITVSYARENEILLVFKDDGLGMASEECELIFERNYQGKNGTSGSGMGLFLAKSSVTAHGGSISAKSEYGKGMGIYITLPVSRASEVK